MTPKKYPQNFHTQKNIHFSENPKNIEIQKSDPQKMVRAYVRMKIEYPPPGPSLCMVCYGNVSSMNVIWQHWTARFSKTDARNQGLVLNT